MGKRSKTSTKAKIEQQRKHNQLKHMTAESVSAFTANRANVAYAATDAPPATDLPPSNIPAAISRDGIIKLSCGENLSPLTADVGLLQQNP
jgi:hypothetical protein